LNSVTVCQKRRQHGDRVEAATQKHQRRDDQQWHKLQLLKVRAQMPMMKPNSANDRQVSSRKATIASGCCDFEGR
jgi:hypothetical protein